MKIFSEIFYQWTNRVLAAALLAAVVGGARALAAGPKFAVDENNFITVDGKKVLPIAVWAQPEDSFAMWKGLGVNLFMASSHPRKGGTLDEYLKAAGENNVYESIGYHWAKREGKLEAVLKNPQVLSLHHDDEPDMPRMASDARIEPGANMRVNESRPLFTMVDGRLNTSAVIDPPQGAEFTIRLKAPVKVEKLVLAIDTGNVSAPKMVEFLGDGKSLARVEVANKKGLQEFALKEPASFTALTVKVLEAYEGKLKFGTIAEVQGLDASRKNVLLSESRLTAREAPDQIWADYQAIKSLDSGKLVSLCIMARFMPEVRFQKISEEMYRQYPLATDMLMFDLYPYSVYKGKNLHWNALGLDELRQLSGYRKALGIWLQASDALGAGDPGMSPEQMRADVWLALIHGATYIGYFPQTLNPEFKFYKINEERRTALKKVNQEITALSDLILTPAKTNLFTVTVEGGRVDVMQRQEGDKALLVLVNVTETGPGKNITVKISPKAFALTAPLRLVGAKEALPRNGGGWSVELKPWETAVLVADRAR